MYEWIKAFHIIAVVCWFASIFYLPRLFVYHAMSEDKTSRDRFKIMEYKLHYYIGTPSMVVTLLLGGALSYLMWSYLVTQPWFWIKLFLVFLLVGYHHMCGAYVRKFGSDSTLPSHKFFRVFNEIPVILLIAIVILVVVKAPA